jgi:hypothetical protein
MLIAALIVGGLTAYYFGLRAGAAAAVAAFVLLLVPIFFPRYAMYCWVGLAVVTIAMQQIGSKRQRPPDAVLAAAWVRRRIADLWSRFGSKK